MKPYQVSSDFGHENIILYKNIFVAANKVNKYSIKIQCIEL